MLESATILGIIRKNAVHASLKGDGRFTGMPRMTIRLRYRTWKLHALCCVLRRLRAGRGRADGAAGGP
jgi:hypothetical protein